MKKAARIGSLVIAIIFAGALLFGIEFEQWVPIDVAALIVSATFAVGLLVRGDKTGWYYFIVSAALLSGLLTYQHLGFWVVLDLIVIGLNVVLFFRMGQKPPAHRHFAAERGTEGPAKTISLPGIPETALPGPLGDEKNVHSQIIKEFPTALRQQYSRMVSDIVQSFRELAQEGRDIQFPPNLEFEVASLLYFAYDFAISSGNETAFRSSLRDAFVAVCPPNAKEASEMLDRVNEYASALRSGDQSRSLLKLGSVFAEHVGHSNNLLIAFQASNVYTTAYRMVADIVNAIAKELS